MNTERRKAYLNQIDDHLREAARLWDYMLLEETKGTNSKPAVRPLVRRIASQIFPDYLTAMLVR